MQLQFSPIWPWPLAAIFAVALVFFSHWTYLPNTPRRKLLLGLRWAMVTLVLFAALRPQVVFSKRLKQSSTLVVLTDKSRSMELRDMWDGKSRWDALNELLISSVPALDELVNDVELRWYQFAREVVEGNPSESRPDGDQTALGDALRDVLDRLKGHRLAGIVVLSDGANTAGSSPSTVARDLAAAQAPVYSFVFGRETATDSVRDVGAESLRTSPMPIVFEKNRLTVRGEFAVHGFPDQPIAVRLLMDGVEQARGTMQAAGAGNRATIELSAVAERSGDVKVTLQADPQSGELLPGNNSISTFVTVRAGGISVLHIEGKYRAWEPKFIRWALDQSQEISLNQLFLLDTDGRTMQVADDLFQPGRFDVIILGDVRASQLTASHQQLIRERVNAGVGLIMLGGHESFGPGGWGQSAIAEVLPTEMRPADGQSDQPLKIVPTATGLRHYVLRLAETDDANRKVWESLRGLDGGSNWTSLKPGAIVLAETPEKSPLLVSQEFGSGRTLAFAGDTTWRWRFQPAFEAGRRAHNQFWRQIVLWLARKEDSSGANVDLRLGERRITLREKLPIEVRVAGNDGKPLADAQVKAVVQTPTGAQLPVDLVRQGEVYKGGFYQSDVAGDYVVRVEAIQAGTPLGAKAQKFLVYEDDAEMRQLAADPELLEQLAKATSGVFHSRPEDLPKFFESLKNKDLKQEATQPVLERLWDRWELFIFLVALLSAEWVVRKRHGLV